MMSICENELISPLKFIDYTVNNVSFITNQDYDGKTVDISFAMNCEIREKLPLVNVILCIDIFPDPIKNNYPFEMSLKLTGMFEVEDANNEAMKDLIEKNTVSILFPYIRALITTFTSNCNVSPLILPPINVNSYFEKSKNNTKEE